MGKNTQRANARNLNNAKKEVNSVIAGIKDGTATTEQIEDLSTRAASGNFHGLTSTSAKSVIKDSVKSLNLTPEKISSNPLFATADKSFRDLGVLPPTAFSQVQDLIKAQQESSQDQEELQRTQTQSALDVFKEFGGLFAGENAEIDQQLLEQYGPLLTELDRKLNPEDAALRDELNRQVGDELALGGQLSGEQNRLLEQSIRSAQTARGTEFGNSAVSAEALAKGSYSEALKADRRNSASALLQLNAQTQLDPIASLLGRQTVRSAPNTQFAQSFQPFAQQQQMEFGTVPYNQFQIEQQQAAAELAAARAERANKGSGPTRMFNKLGSSLGEYGGALGWGGFGSASKEHGGTIGGRIGSLFE